MIRLALEKDIEKIDDTYTELLVHEQKYGSNTNWILGSYPTIDVPKSRVPKNEMYVLEENGEICASMVLNKDQGDDYKGLDWQYITDDEKIYVIHTLCIPPSKAGKGYGKKMVEYVIAKSKEDGIEAIRLDTYSGNEPAKSLYTKLGFRIVGYREVLFQGVIPEELVFLEFRI